MIVTIRSSSSAVMIFALVLTGFEYRVFEEVLNRTGKFSGTFVQVDIGLLADEVGVSATDTLDLGQGVDDLLLAVNVGVEQTQDELEVRLLKQVSQVSTLHLSNDAMISMFEGDIYLLARHERHAEQP